MSLEEVRKVAFSFGPKEIPVAGMVKPLWEDFMHFCFLRGPSGPPLPVRRTEHFIHICGRWAWGGVRYRTISQPFLPFLRSPNHAIRFDLRLFVTSLADRLHLTGFVRSQSSILNPNLHFPELFSRQIQFQIVASFPSLFG